MNWVTEKENRTFPSPISSGSPVHLDKEVGCAFQLWSTMEGLVTALRVSPVSSVTSHCVGDH